MAGLLMYIGVLIVFAGFLMAVIGLALTVFNSNQNRLSYTFGGFIGFLPFGFAIKKEFLYLIIILSGVFFIFFLLLNRKMFI
jgi:uncharacterized membrane protein